MEELAGISLARLFFIFQILLSLGRYIATEANNISLGHFTRKIQAASITPTSCNLLSHYIKMMNLLNIIYPKSKQVYKLMTTFEEYHSLVITSTSSLHSPKKQVKLTHSYQITAEFFHMELNQCNV